MLCFHWAILSTWWERENCSAALSVCVLHIATELCAQRNCCRWVESAWIRFTEQSICRCNTIWRDDIKRIYWTLFTCQGTQQCEWCCTYPLAQASSFPGNHPIGHPPVLHYNTKVRIILIKIGVYYRYGILKTLGFVTRRTPKFLFEIL